MQFQVTLHLQSVLFDSQQYLLKNCIIMRVIFRTTKSSSLLLKELLLHIWCFNVFDPTPALSKVIACLNLGHLKTLPGSQLITFFWKANCFKRKLVSPLAIKNKKKLSNLNFSCVGFLFLVFKVCFSLFSPDKKKLKEKEAYKVQKFVLKKYYYNSFYIKM